MSIREFASIVLDCCGEQVDVAFSEADAPCLAPRQLRRNVTCPGCPAFVILTLTRRQEGGHQIGQEVIRFEASE